jgi:hypothetical protein
MKNENVKEAMEIVREEKMLFPRPLLTSGEIQCSRK